MDWDMCNMAAKTKSCCHCLFCRLCNIFVLRAMSSFHHLSFQSQLGSLLFSLLLQVITLCLWQACAPAVERPRCAFGSCPSCPFAFGCHVPLPLASPCARRGTPEVRLWLVSIMSLCLWQARAPAVERPRCVISMLGWHRGWCRISAIHDCVCFLHLNTSNVKIQGVEGNPI